MNEVLQEILFDRNKCPDMSEYQRSDDMDSIQLRSVNNQDTMMRIDSPNSKNGKQKGN